MALQKLYNKTCNNNRKGSSPIAVPFLLKGRCKKEIREKHKSKDPFLLLPYQNPNITLPM